METKSQLTTLVATKSCPSAPEANGCLSRKAKRLLPLSRSAIGSESCAGYLRESCSPI